MLPPLPLRRFAASAFDDSWLWGSPTANGAEPDFDPLDGELDCSTEAAARFSRLARSSTRLVASRRDRPDAAAAATNGNRLSASSSSLAGGSLAAWLDRTFIDPALARWRASDVSAMSSVDKAAGGAGRLLYGAPLLRELALVPPTLPQAVSRLAAAFPASAAAAPSSSVAGARLHPVWPIAVAPGTLPPLPAPHRRPSPTSADSSLPRSPPPAAREVVLRVAIFPADDRVHRHSAVMRPLQEFDVLGSTPLVALRDAIKCPRELVAAAAAESACSQPPPATGAMFYIEGVCYNDLRPVLVPAVSPAPAPAAPTSLLALLLHSMDDDVVNVHADAAAASAEAPSTRGRSKRSGKRAASGAHRSAGSGGGGSGGGGSVQMPAISEASETVVPPSLGDAVSAWANSALAAGRASGWGRVDSRTMGGVTFGDLCPRLGAHYLFSHLGGACEHLLIFTDVRLHSALEDGALTGAGATAFPLLRAQARFRRRRCAACAVRFASLAVYGHPDVERNPEYLCAPCFELLEDGGGSGGAPGASSNAPPREFFVVPYLLDLQPLTMAEAVAKHAS